MAAQIKFAKPHPNKPRDLWNNVPRKDKTKAEMFDHNPQNQIWAKPNTANELLARSWRNHYLGFL